MRGPQICAESPVAEADDTESLRTDALPEHSQYRDDGCELFPSCLNCPLPLCRYDQPGGVRRLRTKARDKEIVRLRRRGHLPVDALAHRFGVSRRTIFRILERNAHPKAVARPQPDGHQQNSFAHPWGSAEGVKPPLPGFKGCPLDSPKHP